MTIDERSILAKQPIVWTGDLSDDCTAEWAGLMLRAEWMDEDYWWWAVYDMQRGEITIDDSNEYSERFIGGEISRKKTENVAEHYISILTSNVAAKYLVTQTFKITGRGLVFAGYITEGLVSIGDTIEFTAFGSLLQRKITGIEGIRKSQSDKVNTGLLIKCNNDSEIDELSKWKPENVTAIIYKTGTPEKNGSH
jgi:hypothetical protein